MGTYTANKNLFMPTVGEQGWGTLVNGNFETIDNFLKPITESNGTYTFTGNQPGGSISATSITNSGTLTSTGKITANGGIGTTSLTTTSINNSGTLTQTGTSTFAGKITANGGIGTTSLTTSSTITSTGLITANGGVKGNLTGNVIGNVTGKLYVGGNVSTSGTWLYKTLPSQTITYTAEPPGNTISTKSGNYTFNSTYSKASISYPIKVSPGIYIPSESALTGTVNPTVSTRLMTMTVNGGNAKLKARAHYSDGTAITNVINGDGSSETVSVNVGSSIYFVLYNYNSIAMSMTVTATFAAGQSYYITAV